MLKHILNTFKQLKKKINNLNDTHGPDVTGFGRALGVGAEGVNFEAAPGSEADGAADGDAASGGGISTCFQSCPSSTMRAIREPRRTLRLPSFICKEAKQSTYTMMDK